jgi:hypothetical protein
VASKGFVTQPGSHGSEPKTAQDVRHDPGPFLPVPKEWDFGEGDEGIFVQPAERSEQVLLVGRTIPWWGMVVARLECTAFFSMI